MRAVASPVSRTRISILDGSSFPNGFLPPCTAFSYYEEAPAPTVPAGALDPPRAAVPTIRKVASKWAAPPEGPDEEALEAFLKEIKRDTISIGLSWRPVYHYLREALRWCWAVPGFPVPKPVTFAIFQFIVKGITGFVATWLYEVWLNDGLKKLQIETSISIAALMCVCRLVEWRAQMLYSGRWDVQRKLQMLLIRKYLTLDEADLGALSNSALLKRQGGNLEDTFRIAILETAVDLSSNCFLAAHCALGELWGIGFALAYILYKWSQTTAYGSPDLGYRIGCIVVAPVVIFLLLLFGLRAAKTWQYWKAKFLANIVVQAAISFVLSSPNLVKSVELEHEVANRLYVQITGTLWASCERATSELNAPSPLPAIETVPTPGGAC